MNIKKMFKKIIVSVLSFVMVVSASVFLTACGEDRSAILKLYVPGEYISQEVVSGFEAWYYEQTGNKITVKKTEFDTNETLYSLAITKKADYDVICPSDYMLERMKNEGHLVKINEDVQNVIKSRVLGEHNENQDLYNIISLFDADMEYTVPYMWGTMGVMYYYNGDLEDSTAVLAADAEKASWNCLFDGAQASSVYMKDSYRDTYTVALLNYYYNDLKTASNNFTDFTTDAYQNLMTRIFNKGTDQEFAENVNNARIVLQAQKPKVYKYEVDDGKDDLITNNTKYGMFWSCDAGYIMADFSGEEVEYGEHFRYIVAEEGSNVWVDNFCITKYAKNKDAANLFMLYITDPDVAYSCMDYAGCTSAIYETTENYFEYLYPEFIADGTYTVNQIKAMSEDELIANDLVDEDGEYVFDIIFAECSDAFKSNYLSLMFPNKDITVGAFTIASPLARCGIMRDLGSDADEALLNMWTAIKR